jgi:hypothetical protein
MHLDDFVFVGYSARGGESASGGARQCRVCPFAMRFSDCGTSAPIAMTREFKRLSDNFYAN